MLKFNFFLFVFLFGITLFLFGTPSTQIWNPSTDLQAPGTFHLGIDNYFTYEKNGYDFPTDLGVTFGIPFLEVGADIMEPSNDPFYFNAKTGIKEDFILNWFPSISAGIFNAGIKKDITDYNIIYGVVAKTIKIVGRISVGYFSGNEKLFLGTDGKIDNSGVILTWDRTISEISDKLWLCVDYAGTKSWYGSLSSGLSYMFAPNVGVIFGWTVYNNKAKDTITTQLDINI